MVVCLLENLCQLGVQLFFIEFARHNLALRIDEQVVWDGVDMIDIFHQRLLALQVRQSDTKDSILVGLALERELAIGHNGAVHCLRCQTVFQIDRLIIFITHTLDGVLHLLSINFCEFLCYLLTTQIAGYDGTVWSE